ncbi:MAG: translation initiation factor IF-2 [Candidatus Omnitrophota bacterium]
MEKVKKEKIKTIKVKGVEKETVKKAVKKEAKLVQVKASVKALAAAKIKVKVPAAHKVKVAKKEEAPAPVKEIERAELQNHPVLPEKAQEAVVHKPAHKLRIAKPKPAGTVEAPLHPVPVKEEFKKEPLAEVAAEKEKVKLEVKPIEEKIISPVSAVPVVPAAGLKELVLNYPISVKDLSVKLQEKSSVVIKTLMSMGVMSGINQFLPEDVVKKVCEKYGFRPSAAPDEEEFILSAHNKPDSPELLKPRPPIVTIMGHVDHGKTSLLDAIRKTNVADSEFGGITQHIGAYRVSLPKGQITFLDTPGHEAFTAMRARGAKATDIVVLVVAADDGIMPQTQESIDHARAAGVSIIVAVNKIDKPQADLDRVKKQLSAGGLLAEDWGGKIITVPVSAKTGQGIETLLEMILLEAEMLELKANPGRLAKGVVLEGKMVKSKGPVSTLLVQNGTLNLNSSIIVGSFYGKIRAMFNDHHQPVISAGPSTPVEVLGISGVPEAGEQFFVVEDEKTAKELIVQRQEKDKLKQMQPIKRMGLEDLYSQIKEGKVKELKIVLKADAQGSIEAIKGELGKIESKEVQLQILHEGIGNINYSDVILALASNTLILGFNVVVDEQAKEVINKEGQDVRIYNIIYELVNEIRAALEGMLAPKLKRVFLGRADIRKIFKLSSGDFAGCMVTKGKIVRSASVCLIRNGVEVYEGTLSSLKRFKEDVREVEEGFECGMSLKGNNDILEGDVIEAFQIQKIARTLD